MVDNAYSVMNPKAKQVVLVIAFLLAGAAAFGWAMLRGRYDDLSFWFVVGLWIDAIAIAVVLSRNWDREATAERRGFEVLRKEKDERQS